MILDVVFSSAGSPSCLSNVQFFDKQWEETRNKIEDSIFKTIKMLEEIHFDLTTDLGSKFSIFIASELESVAKLPCSDVRINAFYRKMQHKLDQTLPLECFLRLKNKFEDQEMINKIIIAHSYRPILNLAEILNNRNKSIIDYFNELLIPRARL